MSNYTQNINGKPQLPCEQFGNFVSAPTLPPPPLPIPSVTHNNNNPSLNEVMKMNEKYLIDNAVLYKKLSDIESELKILKDMINNLYYPRPTYYPQQPFISSPTQSGMMMPQKSYAQSFNPNQSLF
jgi:hypothetical protein